MFESMLAMPKPVAGLIIEIVDAGVASVFEAPFPLPIPMDADTPLSPTDAPTPTESIEGTPMTSRSSSSFPWARVTGKIDARRPKVRINSIMLVRRLVRIY